MLNAEFLHPPIRSTAEGISDVGSPLGDIQPEPVRDSQHVADISHVCWDLGPLIWTGRTTTVGPPLQFMKKEKVERRAREFVDIDDVVWVDLWKVHNPWHENVDLESLEAGFVTTGVPPQHVPLIPGVPRLDSVEVVVCITKPLLDGLRATRVRGEAKDVKILMQTVNMTVWMYACLSAAHLWHATFAACV